MADNRVLKVDPEQLQSKSDEINTQKTQVMSIMEDARSQINSLNGIWTSEAASEYQGKYAKVQDDVENVLAIMSEYVGDLREIGAGYKRAESVAKAAAEGLPENGVFK